MHVATRLHCAATRCAACRTSNDGSTTFPFELHVGVGYGPIQSVCVGSGTALSGGWMFYVGGSGIDTMLEAFNAATGANQVCAFFFPSFFPSFFRFFLFLFVSVFSSS